MSEQKGIYWLASYPKSGNTWFRIFLAHILNEKEEEIDLNAIRTGAIASCRSFVDEALGFSSAHFSHDALDKLRPAIYKWHAEQAKTVTHHKVHDAYTYLPNGEALIPAKYSLGALYFIRNPLDVAVSFANHMNTSVDDTIDCMQNKAFALCRSDKRLNNQLRQQLLSWSMHVDSWRKAKDLNCLVLRYEDMKENSIETFAKAVEFLKIDASKARIKQAIDSARIERLQDLERADGFREKPQNAKSFFRKGIVGDWKNVLTEEQVERVIHHHQEVMEAFGYL